MGNSPVQTVPKNEMVFTDHTCAFYEDDRFLCEAVAEFFSSGLRTGQPLAAVVTPQHREQISQLLTSAGFDLSVHPRVRWLDAYETLATFMNEYGMPDPNRFRTCVGGIIEQSREGHEHLTVRVFGEMVDLLARAGNLEAAVRLEDLWNELGKSHGFSLMCAYTNGNFYRQTQWKFFQRICDQHKVITFASGVPRTVKLKLR